MNVLSLFAGCGGCSIGLKQAGLDVKLAVDIHKDACETYALNLGRESVRRMDLATISPASLLEESRLKLSEVDVVVLDNYAERPRSATLEVALSAGR